MRNLPPHSFVSTILLDTTTIIHVTWLVLLLIVFPENVDSSQACSTTIDCQNEGLICSQGQCLSLSQSTGLEGWIIGTIVIAVTLVVLAIGGCCYLWPSCPGSYKFAHPLEKEKMKFKELERKHRMATVVPNITVEPLSPIHEESFKSIAAEETG